MKGLFYEMFVYTNKLFQFVTILKSSESRYCKCIYFSANALAHKIEKIAIESWHKVQLSPSHAYLLMIACEAPGVQPGKLAEELQLPPSTITRLIVKLEEKKLLIRVCEGKLTNVYPTPKGKGMLPELKTCMTHFYKHYSDLLGKEVSAKLITAMNKATDKL